MTGEKEPPAPRVPDGYRTGLITAITVFLGFGLAFVRYWSLEAPGEWSPWSVASELILGSSIALQLVSLFRALDVRDHEVRHYRVTVRWFLSGVVVLVLGLALSILSSAR